MERKRYWFWSQEPTVLAPALPLISSMDLNKLFYPLDFRVQILEMRRLVGNISWYFDEIWYFDHLQRAIMISFGAKSTTSSDAKPVQQIYLFWRQFEERIFSEYKQLASLYWVWDVTIFILPWPLLSAHSSEHSPLPIFSIKWNEP